DMTPEDIDHNVPDRYVTRGPRSPPVLCSLEFIPVFNSLPPPPSGTDASVSFPPITNFSCPRPASALLTRAEPTHSPKVAGSNPSVASGSSGVPVTAVSELGRFRQGPVSTEEAQPHANVASLETL